MRTVRYTVETERLSPDASLRTVFLSDLHGKVPEGLLERVKAEKPELIFLGGDILERYCSPTEDDDYHRVIEQWTPGSRKSFAKAVKKVDALLVGKKRKKNSYLRDGEVLSFLSQLVSLAPTYYVAGNHEKRLEEETLKTLDEMGVHYLSNNALLYAERGNTPIWVGGVDILYDEAFLDDFSGKEGVRILLCHCPDYYPHLLKNREFDLILSGHAHGGQWRIFGRGVFAPGQGLFPRYAGGLYHGNFVVGRGLANTAFVPRFFNPREAVTVVLRGKSQTKRK